MERSVVEMTSDRKSRITLHYMPPGAKKRCYTFMMNEYNILTTVTSDSAVVGEWIQSVKDPDLIWGHQYYGFEIEMDLTTNRIGTLQLCAEKGCLVFQLPDAHSPPVLPPPLLEFLADKKNRFVSTDIVSKVELLRTKFPFESAVKVDEMTKIEPFVRDLKKRMLTSMALGVVETNWDRLPAKLSTQQVHYASLKAFLNLYVLLLWHPWILLPSFNMIRHLDGFDRK